MKIEMNTIYHLPTQAHEDDFLKQADKQGLRWKDSKLRADALRYWSNEIYFIKADLSGLTFGDFQAFVPIIEWKIGFTKADMQIGQLYKLQGEVQNPSCER